MCGAVSASWPACRADRPVEHLERANFVVMNGPAEMTANAINIRTMRNRWLRQALAEMPIPQTDHQSAILVVEDEAFIRLYAAGLLEEAGFEVLEAADA